MLLPLSVRETIKKYKLHEIKKVNSADMAAKLVSDGWIHVFSLPRYQQPSLYIMGLPK